VTFRATSTNNAASISGFTPLLALGIPGSLTTVVMLAGFMMWGIRPGPLLFQTKPDLVWGLLSSKFIGNFILLLMNIFLIPLFVMILRGPYTILMCFIVICASVGAFTVNDNLFDVWMMVGFGVLGYVMKKLKYPIVPLVLALVLGRLAENSLRQALILSAGSVSIFFTKPISALFMIAAILAYLSPVIRKLWRGMRHGVGKPPELGAN
jgi:putative tricarboxylic transport membrane protein